MKITTTKIIRELEKKGWVNAQRSIVFIEEVKDIIDEILKEKKGITIKK